MSMDDTIDRSNDADGSENLTRAQKFALSQKEYKLAYNQKSKERAKAAKQTYLARPEVQEKMRLQKEKFAAYRKQKSTALKNAKKLEKSALGAAEKSTRHQRQENRDAELCDLLRSATTLKPALKVSSELNENDASKYSDPQESVRRTPKFTVIHCDRK